MTKIKSLSVRMAQTSVIDLKMLVDWPNLWTITESEAQIRAQADERCGVAAFFGAAEPCVAIYFSQLDIAIGHMISIYAEISQDVSLTRMSETVESRLWAKSAGADAHKATAQRRGHDQSYDTRLVLLSNMYADIISATNWYVETGKYDAHIALGLVNRATLAYQAHMSGWLVARSAIPHTASNRRFGYGTGMRVGHKPANRHSLKTAMTTKDNPRTLETKPEAKSGAKP